jgi:hypothetical protein
MGGRITFGDEAAADCIQGHQSPEEDLMITVRCLTLSHPYRGSRYRLLSSCRIVVVLTVLALGVVFALQGYSPEAITGPMLVLVTGAVAASERLVAIGRTPPVSGLTAR